MVFHIVATVVNVSFIQTKVVKGDNKFHAISSKDGIEWMSLFAGF